MSYNFVSLTGYGISIPSSKRYTESLGGGAEVAGLLIGLYPFLSCFSNVALVPVLSPSSGISMRAVYIVGCLISLSGWIMYATAPATFGLNAVLFARALNGLAGVRVGAFYTARAYSNNPAERSRRMMTNARIMAFGHCAGPMLGLMVESVFGMWNVPTNTMFNADTCPGWTMAVLFLVEIPFIWIFLEEPPHLSLSEDAGASALTAKHNPAPLERDPETESTPLVVKGPDMASADPDLISPSHAKKEPDRNWLIQILLTFLLVFIVGANRSVWEVTTVFFGTYEWGWSVHSISGYLLAMCFIAALMTCFGLQQIFESRKSAMAGSFILASCSAVFFLGHSRGFLFLGPSLVYSAGSLFLQTSLITGMGNFVDHVAFLGKARPQHNQLVMSMSAVCQGLGRATGSVIAPYLSCPWILDGQLYAIYMVSVNCLGIFVVLFVMDLFPLV